MKSNWSTASGDNGTKLLLPRLADYHGKQRLLVSTCRHSSKGISRNLVRVETKRCGSWRKPWKKCYRHIKIKMDKEVIWSDMKHSPQPNFQTKALHKLLLTHLPSFCIKGRFRPFFFFFLNTIWARDMRSENHSFKPEAIYIQLFGHNRQSKLCFC